MEELRSELDGRWKDSEYKLVIERMACMATWPEESTNIKESLMGWMVENENLTLVEEGEDILDGLETIHDEDIGGDEKQRLKSGFSNQLVFTLQDNFGALSIVIDLQDISRVWQYL